MLIGSLQTKMGRKPRSGHTDSKPKHNLGCGMSYWTSTVVMLCIICIALSVGIALCFIADDHNVMFARVLTPAPVVLSCILPSQRFEEDEFAHLQPEPREERRQLLVMIADQFDDRSGKCNARIFRRQATDGLMRRQTRSCRAPDVCPVSRPIRPSNSLMARPIEHVFAIRTMRSGDGRNVCDYGYLNSVTVDNAFLIPTVDEGLRDIDKRHVM